ncbi:hypothetical protein [Amycolatopsis panacis]|nr:hypothetical protein [Amycolatopsis panacis]
MPDDTEPSEPVEELKGPPADKSWLEVEHVRGGEDPVFGTFIQQDPGERK